MPRDSDDKDLWRRIAERWRQSGVTVRPGAKSIEIRRFEARYSVVLPDDVRTYFETIDGMAPNEDSDMFRFWPLTEVKPVHEELKEVYPDRFAYPNCFLFADFSLWCWGYAVTLTNDGSQPGPVFRVPGELKPGEQVASSFSDFMERYVNDPDAIF